MLMGAPRTYRWRPFASPAWSRCRCVARWPSCRWAAAWWVWRWSAWVWSRRRCLGAWVVAPGTGCTVGLRQCRAPGGWRSTRTPDLCRCTLGTCTDQVSWLSPTGYTVNGRSAVRTFRTSSATLGRPATKWRSAAASLLRNTAAQWGYWGRRWRPCSPRRLRSRVVGTGLHDGGDDEYTSTRSRSRSRRTRRRRRRTPTNGAKTHANIECKLK